MISDRERIVSNLRELMDDDQSFSSSLLYSSDSNAGLEENYTKILEEIIDLIREHKEKIQKFRTKSIIKHHQEEGILSEYLKVLQLRYEKLEHNQHLASQIIHNQEKIVEFYIEGASLTTTLTTVMKEPNSALARMFEERSYSEYSGKIFVDRDFRSFSLMINYLRTGELPVFSSNEAEIKFEEELSHWQICMQVPSKPANELKQFDPETLSESFILEANNTILRKIKPPECSVTTLSPFNSSENYIEFKISVFSHTPNNSPVLIGILKKPDLSPTYYWDLWNSTLIRETEEPSEVTYGCLCTDNEFSVGILYKAKQQTVSYFKNGIFQGVAFRGIPPGFFPSIEIQFNSGMVSILQNDSPYTRTFM